VSGMTYLHQPEGTPAVASVFEAIRDAILHGEYPPGSPLPEVPLAHSLEASRNTVREALRLLANLGLVDIVPYRGAFVATLDSHKALEIFSFRALIEGYAARLAVEAGNIRGEALAGIKEAYEALKANATDPDPLRIVDADMEFHTRISAASRHKIVSEHLESLQAQTRQFILATKLYESDPESEAESHLPVLLAVTSGDPDRAEETVRQHITRAGQLLLARMAEIDPGRGRGREGPGGTA